MSENPLKRAVGGFVRDETGYSHYLQKHALCIGIDSYEHWPRLTNACADANAVADELENDDFKVARLLEKDATKERIAEAIQDRLRKEVAADDLVVVFFAGHGHTELLSGKDKGYLVPVEAERDGLSALIEMDQLSGWTDYLKSRHVLYVFDSCFSGLATVRSGSLRFRRDMMNRRARIALTAGGKDQTVSDQGWGANSVFTGQLLLGLRGAAANGGHITAASLFNYLAAAVPRYTNQTPAMGSLPGHEGGDVLLRATVEAESAHPVDRGTNRGAAEYATRRPKSRFSRLLTTAKIAVICFLGGWAIAMAAGDVFASITDREEWVAVPIWLIGLGLIVREWVRK